MAISAKTDDTLSDADLKKLMSKPLIKHSDMPSEMGNETVEILTMAMDKFLATKNYEAASQFIKTTLDKKFGATWQCVIGEGFGFEITCQKKFLLYVYYGPTGILCYKC
mmetsp:Transcript_21656/g.32324  ORF Transcript_21656/g.32324 Transcript_21656/m.32324 type:complete len:109 (+) Transcript_21656:69-395(+)